MRGNVRRKKPFGPPWTRRGWFLLLPLLVLIAAGGVGRAEALEGKVNINNATVVELQALPFIGEVRARAIVEHRLKYGPFGHIDELLASPAIGPRTLEAIRPYLIVSGSSTLTRSPDPEKFLAGEGLQPLDPPATGGPESGGFERTEVRRLIITRPGEIQVLCDDEYYPVLLHLLRSAARRVDIVMFVFRVTEFAGNRPAKLAEELIAARQRGVEVEVILEHSDYHEDLAREHRRLARTLRKGGVTVRFGPGDTKTHNKIILIDERFTLMGSHNLTHSALSLNHECSLLIDSRELAERLREYLHRLTPG